MLYLAQILIGKIFEFIDCHFDQEILSEKIKQPSSTSRQWSSIKSGESLLGKWTQNINESQKRNAQTILEIFGLHTIYSPNKLIPNQKEAYDFLSL